jgi:hypothetical protein
MRYFRLFLIFSLFASVASAELIWKKQTITYKANPADEDVTALYHFKNAGDKPITIISSKSSCGCTVVDLDQKEYQPGEMGTIKAHFTFGERMGEQQKTIGVYTDDPSMPLYTLQLNVYIPSLFTVQPQLLTWMAGEEVSTKSAVVDVLGDDPVEITSAKTDSKDFDVKLSTVEAGRQYKIDVTPLEEGKAAQARIVVESSLKKKDGSSRSTSLIAEVYSN